MDSGENSRRSQQGHEPDASGNGETVTEYRSSSDRIVFVENGNPEGWLSTDTTLDCFR